jgi:Ca-activated chloride channel family protein
MNSLHDGAEVDRVSLEVANLGIAHHLVTRWTSLVAVDVTPTAPPNTDLKQHAIPSMLARGWSLKKLFGLERGRSLPGAVPTPSAAPPRSFAQKQASVPVVLPQMLAFAPPGRLAFGATPAMLFVQIGSAMLGASGLLWVGGRIRRRGQAR